MYKGYIQSVTLLFLNMICSLFLYWSEWEEFRSQRKILPED